MPLLPSTPTPDRCPRPQLDREDPYLRYCATRINAANVRIITKVRGGQWIALVIAAQLVGFSGRV
jgi:hypothetical protein